MFSFSQKIKEQDKDVCSAIGIPHYIKGFSWNNKLTKQTNNIQIGKGEVKLFSFLDDIIVYVENPMESAKEI